MKIFSLRLAILAALLLTTAGIANAQTAGMAVNTTGAAAAATAIMDVSSTTQGMLVPRMTAAQRGLIGSPATGLLVYQTDGTAGFYFYNGTAWTSLSSGSPTGTAGGSLTGTYPNPTIAAGAITNASVSSTAAIAYSKLSLASSIVSTDIAASAVTTAKIADSAVTSAKIISKAVYPAKHIDPAGATSGQVLSYNGTSVGWSTPSGGGNGLTYTLYSTTGGTINAAAGSAYIVSANNVTINLPASPVAGNTITVLISSLSITGVKVHLNAAGFITSAFAISATYPSGADLTTAVDWNGEVTVIYTGTNWAIHIGL